MQAGKLRHRVELQDYVETANDVGELVKTWVTYSIVWASIEPLSGREQLIAQQVNAEISHKLTIRYHPRVTAKHRVKFSERIFDINNVKNIEERSIYQELFCTEAA